MDDMTPEPMRADKDDRYTTAESKKVKKTTFFTHWANKKTNFLNKRILILLLILLILLLIGSFMLFGSSSNKDEKSTENSANSENTVTNSLPTDNEKPLNYQEIKPTEISREATQTQVRENQHQERLEIPDEITDQIAQKIADINSKEKTSNNVTSPKDPRIELDSVKTKPSTFNELTLTKNLPDTHYTIQLSGSSSLENLMAYVKKHNITNYQIYETRKNNTIWFVLIKGDYPTLNDAKSALNTLPAALKTNKPWVKSGLAVQKEKQ